MEWVLSTFFLIICVLLIIVVLLQKGRGGGLGAAFGGAGSSAFGTRIGDVFTWVTIVLVALFLLLAIGTTLWFRPTPTQVARPLFTPRPEQVSPTDVAVVTIGCPTPAAKIYYTLDESTPTDESTPFETAVRIEPPATIKAIAYRSGDWKPSEVASAYYGPREATTRPGAADPALHPLPADPEGAE